MKISKLAKIFAPALAALALLFGACNAEGDTVIIQQQEQTQKTQTEFPVNAVSFKDAKTVDIYQFGGQIPLFFLEGKEDIPYVVLVDQTLQATLINNDNQAFRSYKISNFTSDWTITITNQTQMSKAVFDLLHRSVRFDNYDSFFQDSYVYSNAAASMTDYLKFWNYTATSPSGAQTTIPGYSNIAGQPITLDWSTQDVGIVPAVVDGQCYLAMPLQTFNDIFNTYFVYNGSYIFYSVQLANTPADGPYCQAYWSTSTIQQGNRSQALAEYCYNELCMNLDFNYGLKAMHGIESFPDFDHYFEAAGIKNDLLSTNPMVFATALKDVCEFYFGDGHSNYMRNSSYLGKDADVPMKHVGSAKQIQLNNYQKYRSARDDECHVTRDTSGQIISGGVPAYEVTADGKTAIVRFDGFEGPKFKTAAEYKPVRNALVADTTSIKSYAGNLESVYDTITMISAVNELIQNNKGSDGTTKVGSIDIDIKNVVLDLSCNGGGANHTACFVIAWMLGTCQFDFRNPITGAKWSALYRADVDFDGNFDEKDTVNGKNLFCLISPNSFSCGNMVPAVLKASNRVTILGTPSSGGTSCVQFSSVADGTIIRFSSKNVMSVVKNGSYYDIDQGVEPHYQINIPANFYDKAAIQALVNDING